MNEFEKAVDFFTIDRTFKEEEANEMYDYREVLYELVSKMKFPYANANGGYSCRNCDFGVFYSTKYCQSCGTSLNWGD